MPFSATGSVTGTPMMLSSEKQPFYPFRSRADFEFAKVCVLNHSTAGTVNAHLEVHHMSPAPAVSFANADDLANSLDRADRLLTEVRRMSYFGMI